METLFTSASSTPNSNLVNQPPTTTTKGLALLDTIFASATPRPPGADTSPTSSRELGTVLSTAVCVPVHASSVRLNINTAIYPLLSPSPPNPHLSPTLLGATYPLAAAHCVAAPANSYARRDLCATQYAAQSHQQRCVLAAPI